MEYKGWNGMVIDAALSVPDGPLVPIVYPSRAHKWMSLIELHILRGWPLPEETEEWKRQGVVF